MSFSYGSIPPPDSPPLRATPLSPAPVRSDKRVKRHTAALSPSTFAVDDLHVSGLNLNDDPLDLDGGRRSDSYLQKQQGETLKRASSTVIPVPQLINSLPPHYRHPSPAPSSESATPSLMSSSTSTHDSLSSASKSIVPKLSLASLNKQSSAGHGASSNDSLSSGSEPLTPTGPTFSRSRGKSISRAVGKLASDFLSLKKKDRSDADASMTSTVVPPVPSMSGISRK
ncbi:hypothetical protein CPB86DRAFT_694965 [Serendipita vermifera]|nr:hypothetical protein CPB86DRAFT_694965 [Serendipita vermifera]